MSDVAIAIAAASRAVADEGLAYALVGGFAVSARTEPRFTRDVDLAVAVVDDGQAEALVRRFVADGHGLLATVEQEAVERLATARIRLHEGGLLDLLFASSGIEPEVVAGAETLEVLPETLVPVASVGHLIALKLLSRGDHRPNDQADLIALLDASTATDRSTAERSVALIEQRGFARGRDLRSALRTAIAGKTA